MDDTGAPPFAAEQRRLEFQPQVSFGMYGAWVHLQSAPFPQTTIASARTDSGVVARK